MSRMGFVKRKACSKAKVTVENFNEELTVHCRVGSLINLEEP